MCRAIEKIVVLTFNKFYLPGYKAGGPIRTLANMVDRLGDEFNFRIVTLDRDSGDSKPYDGITPSDWVDQGKARVCYFSSGRISIRSLSILIKSVKPNAIYLNSFFDPTFTQRVLWARRLGFIPSLPIILAPRGEFSMGALELKPGKKKLYLLMARMLGLYKGLMWQASSTLEKADIQRAIPKVLDNEVCVALDLAPVVSVPKFIEKRVKEERLRSCFISRISPMKNLDYALKVLSKVQSPVNFTIYGPKGVPEYWDACHELASRLPEHIKVIWKGEITPSQVHEELSKHDLFFFPTRGENYGHVIHEALSAGLPVLISDQTPWGEVEKRGVGWCLPLSKPERFAEIIDEVAAWPEATLSRVGQAACSYALEIAEKDTVLEDNRRLFLKAISLGAS